MRSATLLAPFLLMLALLLGAPPLAGDQGGTPDEMSEANRAAGLLLRERIRRDRPADAEVLDRIGPRDLLVVRGAYDHVEWVLESVGVPFGSVAPEDLARLDPRPCRAVLVNCPGRVGTAGVRWLREFVRRGGFLLTTDWAALHILEDAFPGTLRYTRRPTRDDVVAIRVLRPEHLFLRHVLTGDDRHLWWLENESYPFEVLDRGRVDVLIDSEEMLRKYGAKPIAATFPSGRGRVVHIVSHFYLQRCELRHPRDELEAGAFAGDLGFPPDSPPVRRLRAEGLGGVPAGKLRSAYSAQQFLANLVISAMRAEAPPDVEPPRPVPPPPGAERAVTRRATVLRNGPGGEPAKALPEGLPLRVLGRRDGWVAVVTPAGSEGWVAADALAE